ncbi:hypothetical protein VQ643_09465 [Pseudomonas sp. F1_0610]|uniref:hypothetical protein n=1 Tax=Pseudomonas sp. F1_0610 TaxID=3114284 RepID=UPI0039C11EB9
MKLDSLELDDQFDWVDEFDWDAIGQEQDRSVSGQFLVQEAVKSFGRPITLEGGDGVWMPLSLVRQLEILRDQPNRKMPLTLPDGRQFWVIFNRAEDAPLEIKPLYRQVRPSDTDLYTVTIRLISVSAPL